MEHDGVGVRRAGGEEDGDSGRRWFMAAVPSSPSFENGR